VVREIADFLGRQLSDEETSRIIQRTRFETMKNDPLANFSKYVGIAMTKETPFMRKGRQKHS